MGKASIATLRANRQHARIMEDRSYARMLRVSNIFTKWHLERRRLDDRIEAIEAEVSKVTTRLLGTKD